MNDSQRGTSSFKSRNIDDRTPSFAILNIDLGWRLYKLSCKGLNYCFKGDSTPVNMMFLICSCVRFFYSFI